MPNTDVLKVLDSNDFYDLCLAKLPDSPTVVYSVVHREYGVHEMSTSILANARRMFKMLNTWEMNPDAEDLPDVSPDMLS